jgi:hypothetical protein
MSAIASTSSTPRNSLLRPIALGGLIIGTADAIIYHWLVSSVLGGYPLTSVLQYIASEALGESAFAGGPPAALLGLLFHYMISFVIAAVFILSASRITLLRRYPFVGAFLYGFGVIHCHEFGGNPAQCGTSPASANHIPEIIINLIDHILVVGLPLGIIVQMNASTNNL